MNLIKEKMLLKAGRLFSAEFKILNPPRSGHYQKIETCWVEEGLYRVGSQFFCLPVSKPPVGGNIITTVSEFLCRSIDKKHCFNINQVTKDTVYNLRIVSI